MSLHITCLDPKATTPISNQTDHAWRTFTQMISDPGVGFFQLPEQEHLLKSCQETFARFSHKKNFIQVGIGGSSLGPEMLVSSLMSHQSSTRFEFLSNIDPDRLQEQLHNLDPQETLYYFVSKSGGTAETMAIFAIVAQKLRARGIEPHHFKDYMVFATDPVTSDLLNLGRELDITCLEIPSNVGGRFSVLSPVGLFPALFAGIDCAELLAGAQAQKQDILHTESEPSLAAIGEFIFTHHEHGIHQTVLMPYSSKLRDFSSWFVQLWAESLGKESKGLTPIASYGATDQHSQVQLFMEGPRDKMICFIEVETFHHDFDLTNEFPATSLQKLSPYSLSQLMKAELAGTQKAFANQQRPALNLVIERLDAHHLGRLILFFEALTALMGGFLKVDPFNQPGVEAGKKYAFEWLASLQE